MNPSIFKAYDIRGIYPEEINEETAYKIGRAFVEYLGVDQVAVGHDARLSAPQLKKSLFQGLADGGAQIIDLGMIGTEVMYFAVGHYKYPAGIMLTASHNPAKYNGMKMVRENAKPIGADTGIYKIRDLAVNKDYEKLKKKPEIEKVDAYSAYRDKINSLVPLNSLPNLKVVVDAGNGVGGRLFNEIFKDTNLEIVPLYFEPDGTFPNHEANPMKEENVEDLKKKVLEENADLGIALDGDGDRVFFVDSNGEFSLGYFIVAILSKKILKKNPSMSIVFNKELRWAIEDTIKGSGGNPIPYMTGHSYIKAKMREVDSGFGGETSSHFYYRDLFYADSSMLTVALLLSLLQEENKTLSELLAEYRAKYFLSGEINYKVEDADETIEKVKQHYLEKDLEVNEMDGISFDMIKETSGKWRFSLRKSNTEPVVRLNIEADSQKLVDEKVSELENLITG